MYKQTFCVDVERKDGVLNDKEPSDFSFEGFLESFSDFRFQIFSVLKLFVFCAFFSRFSFSFVVCRGRGASVREEHIRMNSCEDYNNVSWVLD